MFLKGSFMFITTLIIVLIVVFDQLSKFFVDLYLKGNETTVAIPYVISFQYHENRGAAWGILSEHRWVFMLISTVAIIAILGFLIWTRKEKTSFLVRLSLAFFAGGGIGNMIDRVRLSYVIDFLKFEFIDFPIFNVADSFITIGAAIMIVYLIMETIQEYRSKKRDGSTNS